MACQCDCLGVLKIGSHSTYQMTMLPLWCWTKMGEAIRKMKRKMMVWLCRKGWEYFQETLSICFEMNTQGFNVNTGDLQTVNNVCNTAQME